ncbi:MAG: hypothetical protein LBJ07_00275, partial [Actinomycetes bacterium]|nr:hypothetical protein [Actinomycetes bacterium]
MKKFYARRKVSLLMAVAMLLSVLFPVFAVADVTVDTVVVSLDEEGELQTDYLGGHLSGLVTTSTVTTIGATLETTLVATPAPNFYFVGWFSDETTSGWLTSSETSSTETTWTESFTATATYNAVFAPQEIVYNYYDGFDDSLLSSSKSVYPGLGANLSDAEIDADSYRKTGYHFVNWTNDDDEVVGTESAFEPTAFPVMAPSEESTAVNVYANYEENALTVKYDFRAEGADGDVVANIGGSVSRATETTGAATGELLGSEATAAEYYEFVNWTDEASDEVTDNPVGFIPPIGLPTD